MRVNPSGNNPVQESEVARVKVTRGPRIKGQEHSRSAERTGGAVAGSTNAEISPKAREFAQAKSVAQGAPDVREERIAALKARISEGKYHVDADSIADRMVNDHIRMHGIG